MKNPLNRTSIAHDVMNEIKKHDQKSFDSTRDAERFLSGLNGIMGSALEAKRKQRSLSEE